MPKLAIVVVLLTLAALAGALTYSGYLVVSVVADLLGTGRAMAGLLLGGVLARFPWMRDGKLRTVGLLPQRVRHPVIISLLALAALSLLYRGEMVPVLFLAFSAAFLLYYRWVRQAVLRRMYATVFPSPASRNRPASKDDTVIDVEFREKDD